MGSNRSTGNVSRCQGLSFQSSLPELAGSAICRELKGKTALAEDPLTPGTHLSLLHPTASCSPSAILCC